MKELITFASLALLSTSALAIDNSKFVCTHDAETRVIEVVYPQGSEVPCEVQYTKSTGSQTLWNAQNAIGYCEEKAMAFVEKQQSWGWNCETVAAQTESDEELIQSTLETDTSETSNNNADVAEQAPVAASE